MAVTEFKTPCGILRLTDESGASLPFEVQHEIWNFAIQFWDDIALENVRVVSPDQYNVIVQTAALEIGKSYTLRLYGDCKFSFGDSDERAIANAMTAGKYSLSLGAADPNEAEKHRQFVPIIQDGVRTGVKEPEKYDELKFSKYVLSTLDDWSGFRFRLLDRTDPVIRFRIAWIHHDMRYIKAAEYESAVTIWTVF